MTYNKNYPRPQFVRENFCLLDGMWDFSFDDENVGETKKFYEGFEKQHDICVPFSYETKLSGIEDESVHNYVWYHKSIEIDKKWSENCTLLHFEGSDYRTKLWINGKFIGEHFGGYARFSFDISKSLKLGKNDITVKIEDSLCREQARGKQRFKDENFACWYVQTTGIWKSVWLENVNHAHIDNVKITPIIGENSVLVEGDATNADNCELDINITFKNAPITNSKVLLNGAHFSAKINISSNTLPWQVELWSPQNPALYDVEFTLQCDKKALDCVKSYFGMREIKTEGQQILLNGRPLYQRLILDQGYWEESHLTPPSDEAMIEDIEKIFAMGYNGLRKHQKTEDERFLYHCDQKGMLVWCEMPSHYVFSDKAMDNFSKEWFEIVRQNYNHPSIITWVPFNESWGVPNIKTSFKEQQFNLAIYHLTKAYDSMRPVVSNDGWEHCMTDIVTLHDYESDGECFYNHYKDEEAILSSKKYHNKANPAFANGYFYNGQPVIISEFGGTAFTGDDSGWGYGDKVRSKEDFIKRFDGLTTAVKKLDYVCGYCYTQVTDIQQEVNGLMDIKRNFKVDPKVLYEINTKKVK